MTTTELIIAIAVTRAQIAEACGHRKQDLRRHLAKLYKELEKRKDETDDNV